MLSVTAKTKEGESKQALILRILGCVSFAQAVTAYGLGNSDDPWKELEAQAANRVASTRIYSKVFRALRNK